MDGAGPDTPLNAATVALRFLAALLGPLPPLDGALQTPDLFDGRPLAELARPFGQEGGPAIAGDKTPLADRIVAAEGGPGENPLSSAAGYGQFLRDTWLEMFRRAYPRLAQTLTDQQILALRYVKPLAVDLTDRFARENAVSLQQFGLPANDATLSLAHVVGAGGAINVLTSASDRPVREVLSPKAIAANPQFGDMTADQLRQWAMFRITPPAGTPAAETPPKSGAAGTAPKTRDVPNAIAPAEDFRVGGRDQASRVLVANRAAIQRLQSFLEAAPGVGGSMPFPVSTTAWLKSVSIDPAALRGGDPVALRSLRQAAGTIVFAIIGGVASRPAYREFAQFGRAQPSGGHSLDVLRDLATALAGKMERENAMLLSIVEHRRTATARVWAADRPESTHSHGVSSRARQTNEWRSGEK